MNMFLRPSCYILTFTLCSHTWTQTFETSPFKACQEVKLIKEKEFKLFKEKVESMAQSCAPQTIQVLPKQDFWKSHYQEPTISSLGESPSALDFLAKLGERAVAELEHSQKSLITLLECVEGKKPTAEKLSFLGPDSTCASAVDNIRQQLKKDLPILRFYLALSGQQNIGYMNKALTRLDGTSLIDSSLNTSGGLFSLGLPRAKHPPLESPPFTQEYSALQKYLHDQLRMVRLEWKEHTEQLANETLDLMGVKPGSKMYKKLWQDELKRSEKNYLTWGRARLVQLRQQHQQKYLRTVQRSPFLLALTSSDFSAKGPTSDLAMALKSLLENNKEEIEKTKEALASGKIHFEKYRTDKGRAKVEAKQDAIQDSLFLLNHVTIIEQYLQENPAACSTATGLVHFLQKQDLKKMAFLFPGLIVAGILSTTLGPVGIAATTGLAVSATTIGFGFGLTIGLGSGFYTYKEWSQKKREYLAGIGSIEKYVQANQSVVLETLFFPLNFIGAGAVMGQAQRQMQIMAMKRMGLRKQEIERLIQLSRSNDPKISTPAILEIARYGYSDLFKKPISPKTIEHFLHLKAQRLPLGHLTFKTIETLKLLNQLTLREIQQITKLGTTSPRAAGKLVDIHYASHLNGGTENAFVAELQARGMSPKDARGMCVCAGACKKF
jgi:hypothetical protein